MVHAERLPRIKRAGILAAVAAAHLAMIALLMSLHGTSRLAIFKEDKFSVELVSSDTEDLKPVHAAMPTKQPVPSKAKPISVPSPPSPTPASGTSDGNCALINQLQTAIVADAGAQAAIDQLPVEAQSLSNATVVWSGGWTEVASDPSAPLVTVRNVIVRTLRTIDNRCLTEPVIGPRMLTIPSGEETRLLVIGSGTWSWRQLADVAAATSSPVVAAPKVSRSEQDISHLH